MIPPQLPRGFNGGFVGDFDDLINHLDVEHRGNEAIADALNLMQSGFVSQQGRDIFRLHRHDLHSRFVLF